MASNSNHSNKEDEDNFLNSDKVVSVINLLTKFKIKLWDMPNLNTSEITSNIEV